MGHGLRIAAMTCDMAGPGQRAPHGRVGQGPSGVLEGVQPHRPVGGGEPRGAGSQAWLKGVAHLTLEGEVEFIKRDAARAVQVDGLEQAAQHWRAYRHADGR